MIAPIQHTLCTKHTKHTKYTNHTQHTKHTKHTEHSYFTHLPRTMNKKRKVRSPPLEEPRTALIAKLRSLPHYQLPLFVGCVEEVVSDNVLQQIVDMFEQRLQRRSLTRLPSSLLVHVLSFSVHSAKSWVRASLVCKHVQQCALHPLSSSSVELTILVPTGE